MPATNEKVRSHQADTPDQESQLRAAQKFSQQIKDAFFELGFDQAVSVIARSLLTMAWSKKSNFTFEDSIGSVEVTRIEIPNEKKH